jgi:acyl-coenzyme A thioesterase PaaI-like protein
VVSASTGELHGGWLLTLGEHAIAIAKRVRHGARHVREELR